MKIKILVILICAAALWLGCGGSHGRSETPAPIADADVAIIEADDDGGIIEMDTAAVAGLDIEALISEAKAREERNRKERIELEKKGVFISAGGSRSGARNVAVEQGRARKTDNVKSA